MKTALNAKKELKKLVNSEKSKILQRFFKTGIGEYGEGDVFLGITVPKTREIAKSFFDLEISEIEKLLHSKIHEERMLALFILVKQFEKSDEIKKKKIFNFYLKNTKWINNWDLVDLTAPNIVGTWLLDKDRKIIYKLANSKIIWERRIAVLSTFSFIRKGDCKDILKIAEILISDKHDLIQKAVGWMLREVGKRCSEKKLENFLEQNVKKMPRTMLRYAIERLNEDKRRRYLAK